MPPPGILCFGRRNPRVAREKKGLARIERQSAGLTDTPSTFTSASSATGAGFLTSAMRSISGGPYFSETNAFIPRARQFQLTSDRLVAPRSPRRSGTSAEPRTRLGSGLLHPPWPPAGPAPFPPLPVL